MEKKPDIWTLSKHIKDILNKYPPPDYCWIAWRELSNLIHVEFKLFERLYDSDKTPIQIAEEILKSPNQKKRPSTEAHMSNRGKRGKGKKYSLLLEADNILFNPKDLMKKYNVRIDRIKLISYMRYFYHNFFNENITTERLHKDCELLGITENIMNPEKHIAWPDKKVRYSLCIF